MRAGYVVAGEEVGKGSSSLGSRMLRDFHEDKWGGLVSWGNGRDRGSSRIGQTKRNAITGATRRSGIFSAKEPIIFLTTKARWAERGKGSHILIGRKEKKRAK